MSAAITERAIDIVANGLKELHQMSASIDDTPKLRALRGRVYSFERIVETWTVVRPTLAQRRAMIECIAELRVKLVALQDRPTPTPAPSARRSGSRP